jgi:hypothetical protein
MRLAGIGFAVLIAGSAAAVYVLAGQRHVTNHDSPLSARVSSEQAVGLASPGPAGRAAAAPELLVVAPHTLEFTPVKPADLPAGYPEWTADQMVDGSFIFIYISSGQCLSAAGPAATLRRCDLTEQQRWTREHSSTGSGGLDYWQFRNDADGRCLTVGTPPGAADGAGAAADLQRCAATPSWTQLISFLSAY